LAYNVDIPQPPLAEGESVDLPAKMLKLKSHQKVTPVFLLGP